MKQEKVSLGLLILLLAALLAGSAQAQQAVVQAVLFYSPSCGHCHYVITEVLPPLTEQYGDQLQIVGVNTASPAGQALYQAAIEHFRISDDRRGVPTLIVDSTVLVGSLEIPEQLPGLVDRYLAAGGVGWPAIPGLADALQASPPPANNTPAPTPAQVDSRTPAAAQSSFEQAVPTTPAVAANVQPEASVNATAQPGTAVSMQEPLAQDLAGKLSRDPVGNTLAIVLLVAMLGVVVFAVAHVIQAWPHRSQMLQANQLGGRHGWAIAALCLVGLGVSLYMAFVETTHTTAVCGPVGDCNAVQQSEYASLFGWLPIGVLGVVGYAAMLGMWAVWQWGSGKLSYLSQLASLAMALFGTLFSIYLTFLEPFVIGATCAWCLTSALCMALILLFLVRSMPAQRKLVRQRIRGA